MSKQKQKEPLSIMIAKTTLAIAIFTGLGTIIIGGGVVIMKYYNSEVNNRIVETVDQEKENYYDALEKKCNTKCCLSSVDVMRKNNYKELSKNEKCPDGFKMNSFPCTTAFQWCQPIENCLREGDIKFGITDECCGELKLVGDGSYTPEAVCVSSQYGICLNCGNGICGVGENQCNCPEDCGDENRCSLTPEGGPCKAIIVKYYFDQEEGKCKEFNWGGCLGVVPFETMEDCKKECEGEIDEIFYCEKDNDCLATCTSPGCYNKNWYETIMRRDCEAVIIHSCECVNNKCQRLEEQPDTSDWQTYRNEEFGFEVKYPNGWIVKNNFLYSPEMYNAREGGSYSLFIKVDNSFDSIDAFLGNNKECKDSVIKFTINNQQAVKYTDICKYQNPKMTIIKVGDKMVESFSYSFSNELETINQILSTFKFIDQTSDWQTYRNEEFGFEVKYPENDSLSKYKIKQIGNTFYIAFSDYKDVKDGQLVTIFTKDGEDSLKQAIEKKFLKNFSKEDCFVNERNISYLYKYPENYIVLSAIDYPEEKKYPLENKNNCPYAIYNGKSYFLMDSNHPDKFAYFSIGQYSIPAALEGVEIFWQDTFKFIES